MQSMTGYGRGSAPLGSSQLLVEIRSVNHRFLELRLHLGNELGSLGAAIEDVVRQRVGRGRVDISARIEGPLLGGVQLDEARARAAFQALRQLRDELAPSEPVPLSLLASVPGLFREAGGPADDDRERACQLAAAAACDQLQAMRRAEGARLATDLRTRCQQITRELQGLEPTLPTLVRGQQEKLRARITQLLGTSGLSLEPGRLEHEVAVLADRADIAEELTRLHAHTSALLPLLGADSADPVGHRIDFLLQEMTREANTAAAKLPEAASTQVMLAIKAELLRMREQVQNVL
ncbi:MAG: DUF1732 domain-containing protein [Polyangiales bacterium]